MSICCSHTPTPRHSSLCRTKIPHGAPLSHDGGKFTITTHNSLEFLGSVVQSDKRFSTSPHQWCSLAAEDKPTSPCTGTVYDCCLVPPHFSRLQHTRWIAELLPHHLLRCGILQHQVSLQLRCSCILRQHMENAVLGKWICRQVLG